jgi:uncharacterized damage-inducible protein DinB
MKYIMLCVGGLLASLCLFAQSSDKVIVNELLKHWESSKDLTLQVANAMPDDAYSFKATDAEMSFGGQMNHIAQADQNYCAFAMGDKPSDMAAGDTKAAAVKNLNAAFDYCIAGIGKLTDADLQKQISVRGKTSSAFELFWGGFTHTAHHRGQAEVYLRLKGITPHAYKF